MHDECEHNYSKSFFISTAALFFDYLYEFTSPQSITYNRWDYKTYVYIEWLYSITMAFYTYSIIQWSERNDNTCTKPMVETFSYTVVCR